jgi:hypothetical protein
MTQPRQPSGTPAGGEFATKPHSEADLGVALISDEYRNDIAAVQADPIAVKMAAEIPDGIEPDFLGALREYQRRGGTHGNTHMGAVASALRNLRTAAATDNTRRPTSTEIAALVSELADGLIYDWDKNSGETDVHDEDGIVITFENEIDEDGWGGVRFHVAVDGNHIAHGNVDTDPDSVTVEFDD